MIGRRGRCLEIRRAVEPVSVKTAITFMCNSSEAWQISSEAVSAMLNCAGLRAKDVRIVGFRFANDAVHHLHGFQRIRARRGFGGEHQRVAAVEDGVGHVGSFGARGTRILRHGFEHLRRGDHREARFAGPGDDLFLHHGHFFRAHLHAQIAASHHHAVGHVENLVQIVNGLGLFQLGDDGHVLLLRAKWLSWPAAHPSRCARNSPRRNSRLAPGRTPDPRDPLA